MVQKNIHFFLFGSINISLVLSYFMVFLYKLAYPSVHTIIKHVFNKILYLQPKEVFKIFEVGTSILKEVFNNLKN